MKFSIEREQILRPLQTMQAVVERRQTLPILSNVLMILKGDTLRLTATDLEMELSVSASGVAGERDGEITVPARKLFDLCRASADGALLRFNLQGQRMTINAGRARFVLATLPAAEFPSFAGSKFTHAIKVPQVALKHLLAGTYFAMAQQDVRYYLNGLLLEISRDHVRVVATDGHRLSFGETKTEANSAESVIRVIVPRKSVIEVLRILCDVEDEVQLNVGKDHLALTADGVDFTSKLIDGSFPDYERVIPRDYDKQVIALREPLRCALQRTAVLSNEKLRAVRLEVSSGRMKVCAKNSENEEADDELEVDYQGSDLEIGFNVSYLLDALAAIDGERVRVMLKDSASSALISDPDGTSFKYVVMPMKL